MAKGGPLSQRFDPQLITETVEGKLGHKSKTGDIVRAEGAGEEGGVRQVQMGVG